MYTQLNINNYRTRFILGNNLEEKVEEREVVVNISLKFVGGNWSCVTDDLRDTVCYSGILAFLDNQLKDVRFNLIEKATFFIFESVGQYLEERLQVNVAQNSEDSAQEAKILKRIEVVKLAPLASKLFCSGFKRDLELPGTSYSEQELSGDLESASFVISEWD